MIRAAARKVLEQSPNLSAEGLFDFQPHDELHAQFKAHGKPSAFRRSRNALQRDLERQVIGALLYAGGRDRRSQGTALEHARRATNFVGWPVTAGAVIIAARLIGGFVDSVYGCGDGGETRVSFGRSIHDQRTPSCGGLWSPPAEDQ